MHQTTTQEGAARADTLGIAAAFRGYKARLEPHRRARSVASPSPELRLWRGHSRFFFLTTLALLLGALSLFAAAPAQGQAPEKTTLTPVESGANAPTATTLSFTVACAVAASGRPITGYEVHAVAQGVASLERTYFFLDKKCGSNGPMTLTGLPLRRTATTWSVRARARTIRGLRAEWSDAVELATLADPAQQSAAALTASFAGVPAAHTGNERTFSFTVNFNVSVDGGQAPTQRSFETSEGAVARVTRVSGTKWTVHVRPGSWRKVGIALRGGRSCDDPRAVCATGGRALTNSPQASVGGAARIRVSSHWTRERTEKPVRFLVKLNRALSHEVRVDYATKDGVGTLGGNAPATAGADYTATSGTLVFEAGERRKMIDVAVLDDNIDEGSEYFLLVLSNPQGAHLPHRQVERPGLIRNDDPLQQAWLARFGRTVGGHVTDAVSERLEGLPAGAHATLAGRSVDLSRGEDGTALAGTLPRLAQRFGAQVTATGDDPPARNGLAGPDAATSWPRQAMAGRELLVGSSFHLAGEGEGSGPGLAAWGRMAHGRFDGETGSGEGRLGVDGEVLTGILGADAAWGRMLMGVAVSLSEGEGSFDDSWATTGAQGRAEGTMTTVSPYARFRLTERVAAWGLVGWGTGNMTLRFDDGSETVRRDLSMRLGAVGVRGVLLAPGNAGGMDLALKADAFFVTTEWERVSAETDTTADASRLRLVLEAGRAFHLGGGATLRPSVELGVRLDGGDAETGAGLELGGGIAYANASSGFSVEATVRMLAAHADSDYREWGASLTARLDPGERGRGAMFSVNPTLGSTASATERLWGAQDARTLAPDGSAFQQPAQGLRAEAGYGLPLFGGRVNGTPNLGLAVSDGGARDWRIGWRFDPAAGDGPGFEVNLDAMRRVAANDGTPQHGVMLSGAARW